MAVAVAVAAAMAVTVAVTVAVTCDSDTPRIQREELSEENAMDLDAFINYFVTNFG